MLTRQAKSALSTVHLPFHQSQEHKEHTMLPFDKRAQFGTGKFTPLFCEVSSEGILSRVL